MKKTKLPELDDAEHVKQVIPHGLSIAYIVRWTAKYYRTDEKQLTEVIRGRQEARLPRKVAIFLSQQLGGHSLNEIKDYFGLSHIGSVSYVTSCIRAEIRTNKSSNKEIDGVKRLIIEKAN